MKKGILAAGMAALPLCACSDKEVQQPNIIVILADDLGYGDLSCMGQERFETPNIDRLAAEGILFTRHYAGCSVSAPSRSSLVTGLHTGHTPIRGNMELPGEGQYPIPEDTYTVFRLMKDHGYATGVFGKWGLGGPGTVGAPEHQAVDEFYGYNCQRQAHSYYPYHLWHNAQKVMLEGNAGHGEGDYAPALIHEEALKFINDNKEGPFFMMYTSILPHAELRLPEAEMEKFIGRLEPDPPFRGCDDGPYYKNSGYGSQEHPHAAFAAMVTVLDRQVGEILEAVQEAGVEDNTLIIFTSDNGPHIEGGADPAYFNSNAGLRGIKRDLYEGGIRVPFAARWPGHIASGRTSDHVSAFWDWLPTFADLLGVTLPCGDGAASACDLSGDGASTSDPTCDGQASPGNLTKASLSGGEGTSAANLSSDGASASDLTCDGGVSPADPTGAGGLSQTDGISFLPTLLGKGEQAEHEYLYWEFHESGCRQAVLKGDWKAVRYDITSGGPIQLYNLADDPAEQHDLAAEHPETVAEMAAIMKAARTPSVLFSGFPEE